MANAIHPISSDDRQARRTATTGSGLPWLHHEPRTRWETWFLVGLVMLLAILLLPLLSRVPRAYGDDSWSTMAGYTLAFEGVPRNPGQVGRGGTDTYLLQPRLFPNVVCAAVYRLIGFGLTQGRLVATVFCGVFVFAVYAVMRRLFGPVAAAAVAVMTAVDPWVFLTGRTCREEIFLAALLWLSWWFLLNAIDRRSPGRALGGGLCIGLACWTHPNAVVFTAGALVALCVTAGLRNLKGTWLLYALAGVAVGLAPYLIYVGYVQASSDIRLVDQIADRMGAHARNLAEILGVEKERWVNFLRLPQRAPLLLLYLWAVGWVLARGKRADYLLVVLFLGSCGLLPLFVRVPHSRYLVVLSPVLAGLIWRALPRGAEPDPQSDRIGPTLSRRRLARGLTAAALLVYAGMSLMPTGAILYAHRNADYNGWMARIAEPIPKDAQVMGDVAFWIGLRDRRFVSSIPPYFDYWRSVDDAVKHITQYRPEYLIQSSAAFGAVGGLGRRSANLTGDYFGLACERVAEQAGGRVLTEFYHRDFGAVRAWRLQWPAPTTAVSRSRPG